MITTTTTSSTYTETSQSQEPVPTLYTIRSKESFQLSSRKPLAGTIFLIPMAAWAANWLGPKGFAMIQDCCSTAIATALETNGGMIIVVALSIAVAALLGILCWFLCCARKIQTRETDLSLDILPLGVQRSKTTTITYNQSGKSPKTSVHYYPLLPIESVKDCILLEHVGAFSVSTHVMIRLHKYSNNNNNEKNDHSVKTPYHPADAKSGMMAAFPGAILTFDECQTMVNQIKRALEEVQS